MSLTKVSYSMIQGAPVNILDYGASTSSANNTVAIQAAIDTGKDVFISNFRPRLKAVVQPPFMPMFF